MKITVSFIKKEMRVIALFLTMAFVFNQALYAETAPLAVEGVDPVATISLDASLANQAFEDNKDLASLQNEPTSGFLMSKTLSEPTLAAAAANDSSVNTYDDEGRLIRTVRTLLQADGVTLARVYDTSFNPENGFKTEETFNYYDTQGRNTHRIHNLYCDDGITILQITETHFNVETGKTTSISIRNFNMEGVLERHQRFFYHLNGNLSRYDDTRYDSVTGIRQDTRIDFHDSQGRIIQTVNIDYQTDGKAYETLSRVTYNPLTGLKVGTYVTDYNTAGKITHYNKTLYRADGITLLNVLDYNYNPATGFATTGSLELYNAQGQKTRSLFYTHQANGRMAQIDDRFFNTVNGNLLRQTTHFYNALGKRIRTIADYFYPDGINKSRRIDTQFDPITQRIVTQTKTCYSNNGTVVACR